MTPEQEKKLALISEELSKLPMSESERTCYLDTLKVNLNFLLLDYSPKEMLSFAMRPDYKNNIEAAIKFTPVAISLGYTHEEITPIATGLHGCDRLYCLCQYHEYLKSLGFSETNILDMLKSGPSYKGVYGIIANFEILKLRLKLTIDEIVNLACKKYAKKYIQFIDVNADKLSGISLSKIMTSALSSKLSKTFNLIQPDYSDSSYENKLEDKAGALLDKFNAKKRKKTSTSAMSPVVRSATPTPEFITNSFDTVTTTVASVPTTLPSPPPNSVKVQPVSENVQQQDRKILFQYQVLRFKMALCEEIKKLGIKEVEAIKKINFLMPCLIELTKFSMPIPAIARICLSTDPAATARDLIDNMPTALSLGYNISNVMEIITREQSAMSLAELNKLHHNLVECFGFDNKSIIKIASSPLGHIQLRTLNKHTQTLINKMPISMSDIIDIVDKDYGDANVEALLEHYDIFKSLGFSDDELIRIAKRPNAPSLFSVLLACHADIMRYQFISNDKLLNLIFSDQGITKVCWIYFYIMKFEEKNRNLNTLVANLQKDFKNMAYIKVLPAYFLSRIQNKAEMKFKEFISSQPVEESVRKKTQVSQLGNVNQNIFSLFNAKESKTAAMPQTHVFKEKKRKVLEPTTDKPYDTSFGNVPLQNLLSFPPLPAELEQALADQPPAPFEMYSCFSEPNKEQSSNAVLMSDGTADASQSVLETTLDHVVLPDVNELIEMFEQEGKSNNLGC